MCYLPLQVNFIICINWKKISENSPYYNYKEKKTVNMNSHIYAKK